MVLFLHIEDPIANVEHPFLGIEMDFIYCLLFGALISPTDPIAVLALLKKFNLSKNLEITAETNDGIIMGVQHKKYDIHGVQFHPESIKTLIGIKILKNFINN